jgi:chromosome segregation ATPase
MPNSTDPDEQAATTDTSATGSVSGQQSGGTSGGDDWEARYKGLQKVASKKDATIADMQGKLDKLTSDLEEMRASSSGTQAQRDDLARSKDDLQKQLTTLQAERDRMATSLARQAIIIDEFPTLVKLSKFIPESQTDDEFRGKAKELQEELQAAVNAAVKQTMTGASPAQPKSKQAMVTDAEEDQLWRTVTSLAGIPGKEAEFAEARDRWAKIQNSKT